MAAEPCAAVTVRVAVRVAISLDALLEVRAVGVTVANSALVTWIDAASLLTNHVIEATLNQPLRAAHAPCTVRFDQVLRAWRVTGWISRDTSVVHRLVSRTNPLRAGQPWRARVIISTLTALRAELTAHTNGWVERRVAAIVPVACPVTLTWAAGATCVVDADRVILAIKADVASPGEALAVERARDTLVLDTNSSGT